MRRLFSCSAAPLHNIIGFQMASCWTALHLAWQRRAPSCCLPHSLDMSRVELLEQFFIFVIVGVHYVEKVRENRKIQAFLAGVSAAVVGIIAVVSLDLVPEAIVDWPSVGIAVAAFLLIAFLKRDVALVALGAIVGGIMYSIIRALA